MQRPRLKRFADFYTTLYVPHPPLPGRPLGPSQCVAHKNLALGNPQDQYAPIVPFHIFPPRATMELLLPGSQPATTSWYRSSLPGLRSQDPARGKCSQTTAVLWQFYEGLCLRACALKQSHLEYRMALKPVWSRMILSPC